jgi:tRNA (cmo5U34)-methyltransferase
MSKDDLFASGTGDPAPFEFNESVARVFPDMLRRSIPGYAASLEVIGSLAARSMQPGTRCYDLGCSLGAATLAVQRNVTHRNCSIVAIDNAPAMVERCRKLVADRAREDGPEVTVVQGDLRDIEITGASMVVMNYTLQFLPVAERLRVVRRAAEGLLEGGVLALSEKVVDDDPALEELLVDLHLDHKRRNAYSELEIARKRAALENVLVPESVGTHLGRLREAGFRHAGMLLRYFNFVTLAGIR